MSILSNVTTDDLLGGLLILIATMATLWGTPLVLDQMGYLQQQEGATQQ